MNAVLIPALASGIPSEFPPMNQGYKQTEMGMIPEDWDHVRVGDVATVKGGKRLPSGFTLVDMPTEHPYVRVADMYPGGVDQSKIKYVPDEAFSEIRHYRIYCEDIFISVAGTLGIVGVVSPELEGANLTENADRITDIKCERDYLQYWLMSQPIQQAIESIRTIGAQPKLALGRIVKFDIAIPRDSAEQRAIAVALLDVDALLGALEKLIDKKRAIKQAAMQQLLTGKTRLPGFCGAWNKKQLGNLAHIQTGSRNNQDKTQDGQYPFFVRSATVERINSYSYDGEAILVPGEGNIGNIFHYISGRFDVHQRVYMISRFSEGICGKFVYYIMVLLFGSHAIQYTLKATVDSLRLPTFKKFFLSLPEDIAEQRSIAAVLSNIDAEIMALEKRRDKTHAIKQGMMQQLLTGRVRLVKSRIASKQMARPTSEDRGNGETNVIVAKV